MSTLKFCNVNSGEENINEIKEKNFTIWRNSAFCLKRVEVFRGNSCTINHKKCSNQEICVNKNESCPLNFAKIVKKNSVEELKLKNSTFKSISFTGDIYRLYISSIAYSGNSILSKFVIKKYGTPCTNPFETNIIKKNQYPLLRYGVISCTKYGILKNSLEIDRQAFNEVLKENNFYDEIKNIPDFLKTINNEEMVLSSIPKIFVQSNSRCIDLKKKENLNRLIKSFTRISNFGSSYITSKLILGLFIFGFILFSTFGAIFIANLTRNKQIPFKFLKHF